jgi:hypothetical protein
MGTNPCHEVGGPPQGYVMPWVQVQWMNHIRVLQGMPPYTSEEIKALHSELEARYSNMQEAARVPPKGDDEQFPETSGDAGGPG